MQKNPRSVIRRLRSSEIDMLLEDKTQPAHDTEIVPKAMMDDLDKGLLALGTYRRSASRASPSFLLPIRRTIRLGGGIKYLDTEKMAGLIPVIIADTVAAVRRNTRLCSALVGAKRADAPVLCATWIGVGNQSDPVRLAI